MDISIKVTYKSISIHALREEGDPSLVNSNLDLFLFLSTPSARRATPRRPARSPSSCNFYPRPPRGGRLAVAPVLVDRQ